MAFTGPAVFPSQPVTTTFAGSYPGTQAVPGASEFGGDVIVPANNLYPGSGTFAGQGNLPLLDVYLSFSDVSLPTPAWTWISPSKIRQFRVSRTEGETGTAELVLDNRNRDFDPTYTGSPYYPNVRPLNRVWLREQFNGKTNSMYLGYTESYDQQWPNGGWSDAVAVITAADEFKILALAILPQTNPPRSSYQEVVAFDNPASYWTLDEDPSTRTQPPVVDQASETIGLPSGEDGDVDRGFLHGSLPNRPRPQHHLPKPVGKKAPKKHRKRHFDKPIPIKRPR